MATGNSGAAADTAAAIAGGGGDRELAAAILCEAVALEEAGRLSGALDKYETGISLLLAHLKKLPATDPTRQPIESRVRSYLSKAEDIKTALAASARGTETSQAAGRQWKRSVDVAENDTGFAYSVIFRDWIKTATAGVLTDPYIRRPYQVHNLVRLCELCLRVSSLRRLEVRTTRAPAHEAPDQDTHLAQLQSSLRSHGMQLNVTYTQGLHDRELVLNNGYVVVMGRGLDYFKPPSHHFGVGSHDMNLRACKATKIDVYYDEKACTPN
eukprot:UC1_evm4s1779